MPSMEVERNGVSGHPTCRMSERVRRFRGREFLSLFSEKSRVHRRQLSFVLQEAKVKLRQPWEG